MSRATDAVKGALGWMCATAMALLRFFGKIFSGAVLRLVRLMGRLLGWLGERRWFVWLLSQYDRLERTRWGLIAVLAIAVFALTTIVGLDRILAGMHVPGASSYTINDLSDAGFDPPSVDTAVDVLETWKRPATPNGFRGPGEVVWGLVLADSLFALAYAALLAVLLLKIGRALAAADNPDELDRLARRRLLRRTADLADPTVVPREVNRLAIRLSLNVRLATFALRVVPVLLAFDVGENALIAGVYLTDPRRSWFPWMFHVLWTFSIVKWLLAALVLVSGLIAALSAALFHPLPLRNFWTAVVVLRGQILLLALFTAALLVPDQTADVLRRWYEDPLHALAAVLGIVWYAVTSRASSALLLRDLARHERPAPGTPALLGAALAVLMVGVFSEWRWGLGQGLLVFAAILVAVGIASHPLQDLEPIGLWRKAGGAADGLSRTLAATPLVLLGVALLIASMPEIAYATHEAFLGLIVLAIVLQATGWVLLYSFPAFKASAEHVLWFSAGGALLLGVRVWLNPWRTAEVIGSIGVLASAMAAFTVIAFGLSYASEHFKPPAVFTAVRLKRTPVFVLLALWLVLAAATDKRSSYHDVRTVAASGDAAGGLERSSITAGTAFAEWEAGTLRRGKAVPLVFVSAAGGGIRAAYWTSAVLSCVLEGRGNSACRKGGKSASALAADAVFAASGISGGSLGLAAYATHRRYEPARADWIDVRLKDDYFAPVLAWTLFADLPLAFVRRSGGMDRAEVLERAWERSWLDDLDDGSFWDFFFSQGPKTDKSPLAAGVFDYWAQRGRPRRFPVLLLSGTKVQDGCRFNASVLNIAVDGKDVGHTATTERLVEDCLALRLFEAPAGDEPSEAFYVPPEERTIWGLASTDDLSDFLCPEQDIRLSTQINLSARFPWVEPSGRLEKCRAKERAINLVDGGYFDTSGASPLVEVWERLEPEVETLNRGGSGRCIVPFFVQIDTGYSDPVRTAAVPRELGVPIQVLATARQAREANARQAAALAFSGALPGASRATLPGVHHVDRFAHIYPRAHPGSKAPLGWTLSRTAREDLKAQLTLNAAEIRKVRAWFGARLDCE